MARAYIVGARRTAVAPRGGAFAHVEAHGLAAPVLAACLSMVGLPAAEVDQVILGNALSGGGNVARLAALAAGLPESVPAMTVDTQCCAGLDAILLAARLIQSGAARAVLAGGVESFSRSPLRARRPSMPGEAPEPYERPAFSPWPARDPDPLVAMAGLAARERMTREVQGALAIVSHRKGLAARERMRGEIVPVAGLGQDAFTRALTMQLCLRAPIVAGEGACALDASGVAVEADAAAAVLVVDEDLARRLARPACEILAGASAGSPPEEPFSAVIPAVGQLVRAGWFGDFDEIAAVELMESSAVQFGATMSALGLDFERVNRGGGAIARGHPIGASGAILAVRLFHELLALRGEGAPLGLAAIPAAGGLATALLLQRS